MGVFKVISKGKYPWCVKASALIRERRPDAGLVEISLDGVEADNPYLQLIRDLGVRTVPLILYYPYPGGMSEVIRGYEALEEFFSSRA